MGSYIKNIEDTIDRNYLVLKRVKDNVDAGTVVHIMAAKRTDEGIFVNYRVMSTGKDYTISFSSLKGFLKWAKDDNFIARYHDSMTPADIKQYIRVFNGTFVSSCGIIIAAAVLIVWGLMLILLGGWQRYVVGGLLTVIVPSIVYLAYNRYRNKVLVNLYNKITNNWQGNIVMH